MAAAKIRNLPLESSRGYISTYVDITTPDQVSRLRCRELFSTKESLWAEVCPTKISVPTAITRTFEPIHIHVVRCHRNLWDLNPSPNKQNDRKTYYYCWTDDHTYQCIRKRKLEPKSCKWNRVWSTAVANTFKSLPIETAILTHVNRVEDTSRQDGYDHWLLRICKSSEQKAEVNQKGWCTDARYDTIKMLNSQGTKGYSATKQAICHYRKYSITSGGLSQVRNLDGWRLEDCCVLGSTRNIQVVPHGGGGLRSPTLNCDVGLRLWPWISRLSYIRAALVRVGTQASQLGKHLPLTNQVSPHGNI